MKQFMQAWDVNKDGRISLFEYLRGVLGEGWTLNGSAITAPEALDFSALSSQCTRVDGAHNRGIKLGQLKQIREFVWYHAEPTTDQELEAYKEWMCPGIHRDRMRDQGLYEMNRLFDLEETKNESRLVSGNLSWIDLSPPKFSPKAGTKIPLYELNLYHLNAWLIKAATLAHSSSLVELLCTGPQIPLYFVSHWW